jgi:hypothetical protein
MPNGNIGKLFIGDASLNCVPNDLLTNLHQCGSAEINPDRGVSSIRAQVEWLPGRTFNLRQLILYDSADAITILGSPLMYSGEENLGQFEYQVQGNNFDGFSVTITGEDSSSDSYYSLVELSVLPNPENHKATDLLYN